MGRSLSTARAQRSTVPAELIYPSAVQSNLNKQISPDRHLESLTDRTKETTSAGFVLCLRVREQVSQTAGVHAVDVSTCSGCVPLLGQRETLTAESESTVILVVGFTRRNKGKRVVSRSDR